MALIPWLFVAWLLIGYGPRVPLWFQITAGVVFALHIAYSILDSWLKAKSEDLQRQREIEAHQRKMDLEDLHNKHLATLDRRDKGN